MTIYIATYQDGAIEAAYVHEDEALYKASIHGGKVIETELTQLNTSKVWLEPADIDALDEYLEDIKAGVQDALKLLKGKNS